jgi:hypothetical protein
MKRITIAGFSFALEGAVHADKPSQVHPCGEKIR